MNDQRQEEVSEKPRFKVGILEDVYEMLNWVYNDVGCWRSMERNRQNAWSVCKEHIKNVHTFSKQFCYKLYQI